MFWHECLKLAFSFALLNCPCGGRREVIAAVQKPSEVAAQPSRGHVPDYRVASSRSAAHLAIGALHVNITGSLTTQPQVADAFNRGHRVTVTQLLSPWDGRAANKAELYALGQYALRVRYCRESKVVNLHAPAPRSTDIIVNVSDS